MQRCPLQLYVLPAAHTACLLCRADATLSVENAQLRAELDRLKSSLAGASARRSTLEEQTVALGAQLRGLEGQGRERDAMAAALTKVRI